MKILVSGGSGFLGSNLCVRLLNKGHEVICLDNLSTGFKYNVMEFMFNPKFSFILHDITDPFTSAYVDVVIHCAYPTLKDPLHFLKTCTYGTFNVAGIARRNNARLVYVSSDEYYGGLQNFPICDKYKEDQSGVNLESNDYTSGFQIAEAILRNYKKLDIRVLRLFDFYGPKMSPTSFMGNIFKNCIAGKDILLDENENTLLRMCYVDDVVDAICCAVDIKEYDPGPTNIGTNETIELKDFIFKLRQYSDTKSSILCNPNKMPTIMGLNPLNDRAKKILKWEEKITYDIGIQKTFKYFKEGPDRDYL